MTMAESKRKRIFIAFAIEDEGQRNLFVGQARLEASPFDFVDMSVKEPFTDDWKNRCRSRIKGCDGAIALISKNSAKASGQRFEIDCAITEGIPIIGVYAYSDDRSPAPSELKNKQVIAWTWPGIKAFLDRL
jgi:hypothetical protein